MSSLTNILFAVLVITVATVAVPISPRSVIFLGAVNGKTFFYDNTQATWDNAASVCEAANLNLAEITTVAEQNFLASKYDTDFSGEYWTVGVDAQKPQQFTWGARGTAINTQLKWYSFAEHQTCVAFYIFSAGAATGNLLSHPCGNTFGVLCQS